MRTDVRRIGDVTIEEVDLASLGDAEVPALNAFENLLQAETHPDDPPVPADLTRDQVRNIPEVMARRDFWAREPDGTIAATAETFFWRTDDNRHLSRAWVGVHPDRRRTGLAKALLTPVVEAADAEGRTLLMSWSSERVPAGEAFARRLGAEAGAAVHTNRLVLADVDRELMDRWVDEGPGRAPDYSLLAIDGPYPEELLEGIAGVHDVMNTAPRDDLDMEDWHTTPEQIRDFERSFFATGTERWSLFARHEPTGELVGYTEVYWNPRNPQTVGQGDTGVDPDHRGHALGKWLKAAMLRRVLDERTEAHDVRTGNADSNDAMLGINHAMGFRPFEAHTVWQVPVARVREYLDRA